MSTPAKQTDYITSLNALRGLAALAVVFYHTQDMMHWSLTEMFKRGYLAVDLFFVLSGFVLMHVYRNKFPNVTKNNYWQFITNRFARIYPVHIAMLLVMVFLEPVRWLANKLANFPLHEPVFAGQTKLYGILTNVFLVQAWHTDTLLTWNGPSWSISSEWFAYLLAPFLIGAFAKLKTPAKTFLALLLADVALWLLSVLRPGGIDTTYDHGNLRMLFEFCLGLSVYNLYHQFKETPLAKRLPTDGILFGIIAAIVGAFAIGATDVTIVQLYMLLIPACALSRSWMNAFLSSKPLHHLGEISYSLYMTHSLIVYTIMTKVKRYIHVEGLFPSLALLAGITIASLLLAHCTYTHLEIPSRDRLRAWFKRLSSSPKKELPQSNPYTPQPIG